MRGSSRLVVALVLAALATTFFAVPVVAGPDLVPGLPLYLALGDSWAWGQGADDPATWRAGAVSEPRLLWPAATTRTGPWLEPERYCVRARAAVMQFLFFSVRGKIFPRCRHECEKL